ncbi:MAG TPA: glucose-1-phosphate cytidylyltransferase [Acidimicrobiales bacterium]|nr:glucose-1-phosphate cytidylyltransferase [Acidimicrobiales bacterium]
MKAVILAGGLGTRLREETEFKPKPMVEVGGRPVLWHVMKIFAHHGITDFVICIGYRGDVIKEYFLNYEAWNNDFTITLGRSHEMIFHDQHLESDWRVTVAETGAETETGGRVKMVERYLADDERFMVTYGDGVADVDVTRLLRFHEEHGRTATITAVRPLSRFGSVDLLTDGVVEQFREKPQLDDWVSAGFFVFERGIFDYLSVDTVLEKEPLESLAKESELVAYQHDGFWQPMDTYRESKLLNDLWSTGSAPWKVWPD